MRALTRRVEFLEGERARLEALLADALVLATRGERCGTAGPLDLMRVLADLRGFDLRKAAVLDARGKALA